MIETVWKLRTEASVKQRQNRHMNRAASPSTSGASTSNADAAIDPPASPMASNFPEDDPPEFDARLVAHQMLIDPVFFADVLTFLNEELDKQSDGERASHSERLKAILSNRNLSLDDH